MRTILVCLAALPSVAHSETLYLEYEGTVTSADPAPWWSYAPGDSVKGLAKICADLAPDRDPSPLVGQYIATGTDFVLSNAGLAMARRGINADVVVVDPQGYEIRRDADRH